MTPTPAQASLLAQIAQRESNNNYSATISPANCRAMGYTVCTASGAYQIIDQTWQEATAATGVGTQYASAAAAPPEVQDAIALYLLQTRGTAPWASSAPAGGYQPLLDVSGSAASTPTADLLGQISSSVSDTFSQMGIDPSSPEGGLAIALGIGVVGFAAMALVNR